MNDLKRNNRTTGLLLAGIVASMIGLSFAAVPLYEVFCRVTGFGGTTQVADAAPEAILDRTVKVRFNADVNNGLPWSFAPETREVEVRLGEEKLVFYRARNEGSEPITGVATFNVAPAKAGIFFNKVACFCFNEQTLAPGEEIEMGVYFFVDPEMADDEGLDDVQSITLSYTFFQSADEADGEEGPRISALSGPVNGAAAN